MPNPTSYIFDAFALMAYFENEPSGERVEQLLYNAEERKIRICLSVINLGEVLYTVERKHGLSKAHNTLALIQEMPIVVLPVDDQTVFAAAHVKANYPVSYADAFVIAIAQSIKAIIVTGDPKFHDVTDFVEIEWLQQRKSK